MRFKKRGFMITSDVYIREVNDENSRAKHVTHHCFLHTWNVVLRVWRKLVDDVDVGSSYGVHLPHLISSLV